MSNLEKYNEAFKEALDLKDEQLNSELVYQSVPDWDSVGHMTLVACIEDAFDIAFETDDMIDLSSYDIGKEIVGRYGIKL